MKKLIISALLYFLFSQFSYANDVNIRMLAIKNIYADIKKIDYMFVPSMLVAGTSPISKVKNLYYSENACYFNITGTLSNISLENEFPFSIKLDFEKGVGWSKVVKSPREKDWLGIEDTRKQLYNAFGKKRSDYTYDIAFSVDDPAPGLDISVMVKGKNQPVKLFVAEETSALLSIVRNFRILHKMCYKK